MSKETELFNPEAVAGERYDNAPPVTENPATHSATVAPDSAKKQPLLVEPSNRDIREGKAIVDGVQETVKSVWGREMALTEAQRSAMMDSVADILANIKARLPWGLAVTITLFLMALPIMLPGILKMLMEKRQPKTDKPQQPEVA